MKQERKDDDDDEEEEEGRENRVALEMYLYQIGLQMRITQRE